MNLHACKRSLTLPLPPSKASCELSASVCAMASCKLVRAHSPCQGTCQASVARCGAAVIVWCSPLSDGCDGMLGACCSACSAVQAGRLNDSSELQTCTVPKVAGGWLSLQALVSKAGLDRPEMAGCRCSCQPHGCRWGHSRGLCC